MLLGFTNVAGVELDRTRDPIACPSGCSPSLARILNVAGTELDRTRDPIACPSGCSPSLALIFTAMNHGKPRKGLQFDRRPR